MRCNWICWAVYVCMGALLSPLWVEGLGGFNLLVGAMCQMKVPDGLDAAHQLFLPAPALTALINFINVLTVRMTMQDTQAT